MACATTEYLRGPITLSILDRESDGARIVLLGDWHTDEVTCPVDAKCEISLPLYLETLFNTYAGYHTIDFFVELWYDPADRRIPVSYEVPRFTKALTHICRGGVIQNHLHTVQAYFLDCFQKLKSQCRFFRRPVRFHYADVRSGVLHEQTPSETREVVKELQRLHRSRDGQHLVPLGKRMIQKYIDHDVDFFFKLCKIDKQLRAINDPGVTAHLTQFMLVQMEGHNTEVARQWLERLEKAQGPTFPAPGFERFMEAFQGSFMGPLFDIYVIARIIRHRMTRIIIYGGDAHIQSLRWFFLNIMGFRETAARQAKEKGKHFQCLDLRNTPQPWFAAEPEFLPKVE